MARSNPFKKVAMAKPLLLAMYVTVLTGTVFSTLFILSTTVYFTDVNSNSLGNGNDLIDPSQNIIVTKETVLPSRHQNLLTRAIWDVPPIGSKMPPLEAFELTKEMVKYRAKDNIIIVTFGNYAFMGFILNWVKHLTDLNVFNLLVGAMDTKLLEELYWKGIPVFDMGSHIETNDVGWGSSAFHRMGRERLLLIDALLPFGYELLMCDTDMVWLKNPLPYLARFPEADVLTSSDELIPTVTDDSLEVWQEVNADCNIGIMHWRPTDPSKRLAEEWKDLLLDEKRVWDQNGFNFLVRRSLGPSVVGESGLVYAYDASLKLGILPASIFCNGHTYFVQELHHQLKLEPYAVHTTFQYSGTEGKRHRLREAMLFYDEPGYYDSQGGFLSFKPRISKSLLLDGEHTIESHFSLVNYQLKQIRTALAIASMLNRTLVMPPLWCRFDRWWFGHPGILEGSITRQPFLCPMDHVFEVNFMLSELNETEFGPRIDFREYSFLQNPLLPKRVKESFLEVEICEVQSKNCLVANETTRPGVLRFPKRSSQEKFSQVFSLYKDVKVIQFSSMEDAFQGFTDKAREVKFRNRVKRYVGAWCCLESRKLGHIYYDMYWDEKPGWKPMPPKTKEDDHPPWSTD